MDHLGHRRNGKVSCCRIEFESPQHVIMYINYCILIWFSFMLWFKRHEATQTCSLRPPAVKQMRNLSVFPCRIRHCVAAVMQHKYGKCNTPHDFTEVSIIAWFTNDEWIALYLTPGKWMQSLKYQVTIHQITTDWGQSFYFPRSSGNFCAGICSINLWKTFHGYSAQLLFSGGTSKFVMFDLYEHN